MSIVAETSTLESTVRSLAGFLAERSPVTTLYLDVDGQTLVGAVARLPWPGAG